MSLRFSIAGALLLALLLRPASGSAADAPFAGFYLGSDFGYRVVGYNPVAGFENPVEPDADPDNRDDPIGATVFDNFFSSSNRFLLSALAGYRVTLQDALGGGLLGYPGGRLYLGGELSVYGGVSNAEVTIIHENIDPDGDGDVFAAQTVIERSEYDTEIGLDLAADFGAAFSPRLFGFLRLGYSFSDIAKSDSFRLQAGGDAAVYQRHIAEARLARNADIALPPVRAVNSSAFILGLGVEYKLARRFALRSYYLHGFGSPRDFDAWRFGGVFYF